MPKLTINGIATEVPAGTTVLQACQLIGVEVAHFCFHARLAIAGNCRMCLVEQEKAPKPIASCAMPVAEGMVIHTDSEKAQEGAQGGDGVPADQPSPRLPDLRPGRGMRPPGRGGGLWLRPRPLSREQARRHRQGTGAAGQDQHEPLHPLHPLHPLPQRCRRRGRAGRHRPRRGHGDRHLHPARAHLGTFRQHHRSLPGGRAHLQALCLRRAAVGAHQDRIGGRARRARQQHPRRCARAPGAARAAAPQRGRERGVDLGQDALRARRPGAPAARPALSAPQRQARGDDMARRPSPRSRRGFMVSTARASRRSPAISPTPRRCWR